MRRGRGAARGDDRAGRRDAPAGEQSRPTPPDGCGGCWPILAWLAQVGEASIDEAAARFDLAPEALVAELEMAACCGVPPYTPDQLMEIVVTDTSVSVRVGTSLARPRRLSPTEGFALAASARALLAVPGSDESGALLPGARQARPGARRRGRVGVELDAPAPYSKRCERRSRRTGGSTSPITRRRRTGSANATSTRSGCSPPRPLVRRRLVPDRR